MPVTARAFDLQSDPGETKNLADNPAHAPVREQLEAALRNWRRQTDDPLLDAGRLERWKDAAVRWGKLPPVKAGPRQVVRIPEGELELLK